MHFDTKLRIKILIDLFMEWTFW